VEQDGEIRFHNQILKTVKAKTKKHKEKKGFGKAQIQREKKGHHSTVKDRKSGATKMIHPLLWITNSFLGFKIH